MWAYWVLYLLPALGSFGGIRRRVGTWHPLLWACGLIFIAAIGFRYEVGCDWFTYVDDVRLTSRFDLLGALRFTDPGYGLLNWILGRAGLGITAVDLVCGAIFIFGLVRFCGRQPQPWLTLAVATPYLVIVVAMNYTRQAAALGFVLLAFNAFVDRRILKYIFLVFLAAAFHRSAAVFAPMAIFMGGGRMWVKVLFSTAFTALLVIYVANSAVDRYVSSYITNDYEGVGALYRVPMDAVAAMVFFLNRKRWFERQDDGALMTILSVLSLCLLPISFRFSVAADRVGLYLMPIQVAVFSRVPFLYRFRVSPALITAAVVVAFGFYLLIWLSFAQNASCWIPYRVGYVALDG